jgi:hypothetical protein
MMHKCSCRVSFASQRYPNVIPWKESEWVAFEDRQGWTKGSCYAVRPTARDLVSSPVFG